MPQIKTKDSVFDTLQNETSPLVNSNSFKVFKASKNIEILKKNKKGKIKNQARNSYFFDFKIILIIEI